MAYFTEPMSEEFRKALDEAMKEIEEEKPKKRLSKKNKQEMK